MNRIIYKRILITLFLIIFVAMVKNVCAQYKLYKEVPIDKSGPYSRVYYPENQPDETDGKYFPKEYLMSYQNSEHNSVFEINTASPEWMKTGVSWKFAEARSWPLEYENPFGAEVYGDSRSLATETQYYGNALNVTAVDGYVFAESDDMFIYALNAKTGKLIWRTSPIGNTYMGTPLVIGDIVYITAGSVAFTFGQTQKYSKDPESSQRGAGVSYNGLIALNKKTGELIWFFATQGEVMTTPAYFNDKICISTGAGDVYTVNAETGELIWTKELGGMANMSNPVYYEGNLYLGMAVKPYLYCLDSETGDVIWKAQIPGQTNTGMGDVTPTVGEGIVVMNTVIDPLPDGESETMDTRVMAFDSKNGNVLWKKDLGRGPKPQSYKGAVGLIHQGTFYLGNPVKNKFFAFDLKNGNIKWDWDIPHTTPAGAGRGPGSIYKGTLYIATGSYVYGLNPQTGNLIGSKKVGGYFPILSPTIVGGTMYLGNNYDWVIALPVADVISGF